MNRIDWERWAPLSGIVFVALIVVTFFVPTASPPGIDDPASDVVAWFDKHETALLTSRFISGLALVFFVWFLVGAPRMRATASSRRPGCTASSVSWPSSSLVLVTSVLLLTQQEQAAPRAAPAM